MYMSENVESHLGNIFSATRNSIISATLGIGIYGFSVSRKKQTKSMLKLLSKCLYIYAFLNLVNTTFMLRDSMSLLNDKKNKINGLNKLNYWKRYEYLNWLLSIFIFALILLSFSKYLQKII